MFSGMILDPCMRIAVPDGPQADTVCCFSSWQPGMSWIRNSQRSAQTLWRKNSGQKFCIHTPVYMARISRLCLEVLLTLLLEFDDAVVCYEGSPLAPIWATCRNMEEFAWRHQRTTLSAEWSGGAVCQWASTLRGCGAKPTAV